MSHIWEITNEEKGKLIKLGAKLTGAYLYSKKEKFNVVRSGVKVPHTCSTHSVKQLKKMLKG